MTSCREWDAIVNTVRWAKALVLPKEWNYRSRDMVTYVVDGPPPKYIVASEVSQHKTAQFRRACGLKLARQPASLSNITLCC